MLRVLDLSMMYAASRIAVISNCQSGHNRDQLARVAALLAQQPRIAHYQTRTLDEVAPLLEKLVEADKVGLIAVNGGDGTAAYIFGQLLARWPVSALPAIALLPGGTANMTAGDIGIRGKLLPAVKRLCQWAAQGDAGETALVRRYVLKVAQPGHADRYGMFLGAGAIMQGTEYAHQEIHARGLRDSFSLAITLIRTVWGLVRQDPRFCKPVTVSLRLDDGAVRERATVILAISTLSRLFAGIRPFWGQGEGPLQVTQIQIGATRFVRTFWSILRGKANANAVPASGYESEQVSRIELSMAGGLNLDGEVFYLQSGDAPVRIDAMGPLCFLKL